MHEICLDSNIYPNIHPNIYPNITPRNQNRNPNISKHLNQVSLLSDMVLICLGNVCFPNLTHQHITPTSYPTSKRLYHLKQTYITFINVNCCKGIHHSGCCRVGTFTFLHTVFAVTLRWFLSPGVTGEGDLFDLYRGDCVLIDYYNL